MRWSRALVLGVMFSAAVCFGVVSCGGDEEEADVAQERGATAGAPQEDAEAQAAAEAAVIELEDLPAGWLATAREPSEEAGTDPCGMENLASRELMVARAVSMDFEKEDTYFANMVAVFPDSTSADGAVTEWTDALLTCEGSAILKSLSEGEKPEGLSLEDVRIGRVSLGELGDRSEAVRIMVTVSGKNAYGVETTDDWPIDYVLIRSGGMVSVTYMLTLSFFGEDLLQEMAELAANKLEEGAGRLRGDDEEEESPSQPSAAPDAAVVKGTPTRPAAPTNTPEPPPILPPAEPPTGQWQGMPASPQAMWSYCGEVGDTPDYWMVWHEMNRFRCYGGKPYRCEYWGQNYDPCSKLTSAEPLGLADFCMSNPDYPYPLPHFVGLPTYSPVEWRCEGDKPVSVPKPGFNPAAYDEFGFYIPVWNLLPEPVP